jgi:hypothetical protein
MNLIKYGTLFIALSLSTAAFAQATSGGGNGNGAGTIGGASGDTPKIGGESAPAAGKNAAGVRWRHAYARHHVYASRHVYEGRAAAQTRRSGVGMSGQQRMGNGSNGTNAANGMNGNTTGMGNSQTTNPASNQ